MTKDYTAEWANQATILVLESPQEEANWATFLQSLKNTFNPAADTTTTIQELNAMKQERTPAAEFLQRFETKFLQAGYDEITHWTVLKALLETNLHPKLMEKVFSIAEVPNNFGDFKALVVRLDRQHQQFMATQQRAGNRAAPPQPGPRRGQWQQPPQGNWRVPQFQQQQPAQGWAPRPPPQLWQLQQQQQQLQQPTQWQAQGTAPPPPQQRQG